MDFAIVGRMYVMKSKLMRILVVAVAVVVVFGVASTAMAVSYTRTFVGYETVGPITLITSITDKNTSCTVYIGGGTGGGKLIIKVRGMMDFICPTVDLVKRSCIRVELICIKQRIKVREQGI